MTTDPVLYSQRHNLAVLTLNRPDQLNALNYALIDRLMAHFDTIERDDAIRALPVQPERAVHGPRGPADSGWSGASESVPDLRERPDLCFRRDHGAGPAGRGPSPRHGNLWK